MLKMLPIIRHFSLQDSPQSEKMNMMNGDLKIVDCSESQVGQDDVPGDAP